MPSIFIYDVLIGYILGSLPLLNYFNWKSIQMESIYMEGMKEGGNTRLIQVLYHLTQINCIIILIVILIDLIDAYSTMHLAKVIRSLLVGYFLNVLFRRTILGIINQLMDFLLVPLSGIIGIILLLLILNP